MAIKHKAPTSDRHLSRALYAAYIIIIICAAILFYLFGYRQMVFFMVPSKSMEPSLQVPDHLITLNQKAYHRGNIVVVMDPVEGGGYVVKRIVAVGGDTVVVWNGALVINGKRVEEPYIKEPMQYRILPPIRVPKGEVFLLGDNRNESDDCHLWPGELHDGVPVGDIIGKVSYIYYPFARMGPVAS